jgi:DNA-nicking Smr family endonuclease
MKSKDNRLPRTVCGTDEDILAFLDRYGTRDKDRAAVGEEKKPKARNIEKRKGGVLRMTLDLHGLKSEEASRRLRETIESCAEHGVRELLVIHGRGYHSNPSEGPVLKTLVSQMLENELRLSVRDWRAGLPREGGDGVTVLFLA